MGTVACPGRCEKVKGKFGRQKMMEFHLRHAAPRNGQRILTRHLVSAVRRRKNMAAPVGVSGGSRRKHWAMRQSRPIGELAAP